ncbi:hypothetical protein THAR02_11115 [Trichoderma harzianum]|uniref:Uncharacterized protein n=1 Tax=Trichoderma harzianum TaxID=5544 RepID=A0A0F9X7H9_TRIHA|nr:hypothetical protein THAR02_11115 [Trichoderma harzianum]
MCDTNFPSRDAYHNSSTQLVLLSILPPQSGSVNTVDEEFPVMPKFAGYENYKRMITKISNSLFYGDVGRIRDLARDQP